MTRRRLTYRPLDTLAPATVNPKQHDLAAVRKSIERFGFVEPVLHDGRTDRLIAGHGRLETLKEMADEGATIPEGISASKGKWMVPVVEGWSSTDDDEATAVGLALNRLVERGGWDPEALAEALDSLLETPFGLDGLGWDDDDLHDLLAATQEMTFTSSPAETPYGGTSLAEGAFTEPTNAARLDEYRDKAVRSIILDFTLDEYETVVALAEAQRNRLGIDSNATLFLLLLREAPTETPA